MDYIFGAISLISLGLNYWIYRRVTATYPLGTVEETELAPIHHCCEAVIEYLESQKQPEVINNLPVAPSVVPDYGAWKNEKEIPWVPPVKAPEPIIKAPNRGPLARPDGFV